MTLDKNDIMQRLLDYHFHQDDAAARLETEQLIADNPEIKRLSDSLRKALSPLDTLKEATPPSELVRQTIQFVAEHRDREQAVSRPILTPTDEMANPIPNYPSLTPADEISQPVANHPTSDETAEPVPHRPVLITADETPEPVPNRGRTHWVFSNLRDVLAVAACLAVIFLAYQPSLRYMHQREQQQMCASQLRQAGTATAEYLNDNRGSLPFVGQPAGTRWWDVAQQDPCQYSNTRNVFLLVKTGYASPKWFVCPGVQVEGKPGIILSPNQINRLADFADRNQIHYSFRLVRPDRTADKYSAQPLMTDQNPIFAQFDSKNQREINLENQADLLQSNSPNHQQQGQNVLFGDGHLGFFTERFLNTGHDDIFTIQSVTRYQGTEQPQPDDIFIAP